MFVMIILESKVCFMRKTFLSYLMVIVITFVVGVSMVEAEDYNFSVKLYKFENQDTFLEDYNNGLLEEVPANGVVNVGQKIAVGVYVETKNATASAFDLRLNWDDSILDPIKNEYGGNEFIENLKPISAGGNYPNYDGIDNINITGWKYADYGDYLLIISYVGKLTMLTGEEIVAADINGDGKVNILDQTAMNKLYYGVE